MTKRLLAGVLTMAAGLGSAQDMDHQTRTQARVEARLGAVPPHPRLIIPRDSIQLKRRLEGSPTLCALRDAVLAQAERMLGEPAAVRVLEGRRLLPESRKALARVTRFAAAYRLTADARYRDAAAREMLAAAAFDDWNPPHFLDVAEMTAALALGYDWLYEVLPENERATIRAAIRNKGLLPSVTGAGAGAGWVMGRNNWNPVCHAGMSLGALAIAEDEPALAGRIVSRAVECVPAAMGEYAPDGAYPEGPTYWEYGTSFAVLLIAALESALGTDFGLAQAPGFLDSADYVLQMAGPTGKWFNYSDCGSGSVWPRSAVRYWFAARRDDPSLLWRVPAGGQARGVATEDRLLPLALAWAPAADPAPRPPAALSWRGDGHTPVAVHRTSWTDPDAAFVGIKAGAACVGHAHMDAGSFVMEAGGVRWAVDLGMQSYHPLEARGVGLWDGAQDGGRWRVFRLSNLAHNTLVVDGQLQRAQGRAEIVEHTETPERRTVVDLTDVYRGQLARALRTVTLDGDGAVTVQDEIEAPDRARTVRWAMVTRAEPTLSADAVILREAGRTLRLTRTGVGAPWTVLPTDPPPADYDAPNPGTRMLAFEARLAPGEKRTLKVYMALQPAGGKR